MRIPIARPNPEPYARRPRPWELSAQSRTHAWELAPARAAEVRERQLQAVEHGAHVIRQAGAGGGWLRQMRQDAPPAAAAPQLLNPRHLCTADLLHRSCTTAQLAGSPKSEACVRSSASGSGPSPLPVCASS